LVKAFNPEQDLNQFSSITSLITQNGELLDQGYNWCTELIQNDRGGIAQA
jgi:hypothetical protein